MTARSFQRGDQLWLRGARVTFVDYHGYGHGRVRAAVIRREGEETVRVVSLSKLARDRRESVVRATAIPMS